MTQAVLFTALIPLALIMVLGLALVSGRLDARARDRLERLFIIVFYPGLSLFWAWQAWDSARSQDWLISAGFVVASTCMVIQTGLSIRKRGLPWSAGKAS